MLSAPINTFWTSIAIVMVLSCGQHEDAYHPIRKPSISEGIFKKYSSKLDTAYLNEDYFEIAIQLANLKGDSSEVFKYLDKGIRLDPDACFRVHKWYTLFKENRFLVSIVQSDTIQFENAYQLCLSIYGEQQFIEYDKEKQAQYDQRIASRPILDSTQMDISLINLLDSILVDDQRYRMQMSSSVTNKVKNDSLQRLQSQLDSINIEKITLIIEQTGYPGVEDVGYELASVIWLVLHHQSNLTLRDKYLEFVEANCSSGQITAFKWRSEDIRLEEQTTNDDE